MDVRGRRLRKQSDDSLAFTSSLGSDRRLGKWVVLVNMAHMVSLFEEGEVDRATAARCLRFLEAAGPDIAEGPGAEDIHQLVEQKAVDALGVKAAGFLNYGKSRNDQVATAIRMEARMDIIGLAGALLELQRALLDVARRDGKAVFPGYTHLQRAQPVTLAHYCFAHFDAFGRDVDRLLQLYERVNLSPMGAAALGGTSVRVGRARVAEALGFDGPVPNAMDAVSGRDFVVESLSCATMAMLDLSSLCEELVLWSSKEFGFVELADEHSASSSIMPQKKNPVAAEIARAKAGSVIGSLTAVCAILKSLPYSYNLDLQEATPHLWRGLDDATASVEVVGSMVARARFSKGPVAESIRGNFSTATALANYLVEKEGVSFREAHASVGGLVARSVKTGVPLEELASGTWEAGGRKVRVRRKTATAVLDPANFLSEISSPGGANPSAVAAEIQKRSEALAAAERSVSSLRTPLEASERRLRGRAREMSKEVKR